jgi:uncharacterized LabA/DUF88 family protein
MVKKALILVDVQNVFYGSKNFSEGKGRIDYEKLISYVTNRLIAFYNLQEDLDKEADAFTIGVDSDIFGYVVRTPKYQGLNFFAFLNRIGYTLRVRPFNEEGKEDEPWKGTTCNMMQMDMLAQCSNYDAVVVVSGAGVFEPAFKAVRNNWPNVTCMIAAFNNTLHDTYERKEGLVDHIIYLDERVLR